MTVGTLVRVISSVYRTGEIGVIVKEIPPHGNVLCKTYSVLFWDEKIDTVTPVCLEAI